jgi:DNA replication and repair protein RecF
VHNWRNLRGKIKCGKGLNIIFGSNGQGKTNWLEAIYLLSTTKSFRTQRLQEAILFDQDMAVVRGQVASANDIHRSLQVAIQGQTKQLSVNGKRESVFRYLEQLHVVAFTANEMEVIRGSPDARRRFVDRSIIHIHNSHTQVLANYNKVLKQKNRLLQSANESSWSAEEIYSRVQPWNEQLIALGVKIHRARTSYIEELNTVLERRLFDSEIMSVRYLSSFEGKGNLADYESIFSSRLALRLDSEVSAGYALIGPHRDDLEILFNGRNIRSYGSSGQQRSALIILDLAVLRVYHTWHNEHPIYLFDDIDAELDDKRIDHLVSHLDGGVQTIITTSKIELINRYASRADVYEIVSGEVTRNTLT